MQCANYVINQSIDQTLYLYKTGTGNFTFKRDILQQMFYNNIISSAIGFVHTCCVVSVVVIHQHQQVQTKQEIYIINAKCEQQFFFTVLIYTGN